eukprot:TRINITY_DN14458_c0_g1_i1.p1 TRINITY_DN14458_c0_g1~~TRINITY_DN14458_c0_g1_i1.p1  ORF type:complete len:272 (-),score=77.84 TRINITY_DN14458_c0_g1_i1:135-950(-)
MAPRPTLLRRHGRSMFGGCMLLVGCSVVLRLSLRVAGEHLAFLASATAGSSHASDSAPAEGLGRRQQLFLGLAAAPLASASLPAHAEPVLTPLLQTSLMRYGGRLQGAADFLVFKLRPQIDLGNWTGVQALCDGGVMSPVNRAVLEPVEGIVIGNTEVVTGAEEANVYIDAAIRVMAGMAGTPIIYEGDEVEKKKVINEVFETIRTNLNAVLLVCNQVAEAPLPKKVQPGFKLRQYELIPDDVSKYSRSAKDMLPECSSLDGLFYSDKECV